MAEQTSIFDLAGKPPPPEKSSTGGKSDDIEQTRVHPGGPGGDHEGALEKTLSEVLGDVGEGGPSSGKGSTRGGSHAENNGRDVEARVHPTNGVGNHAGGIHIAQGGDDSGGEGGGGEGGVVDRVPGAGRDTAGEGGGGGQGGRGVGRAAAVDGGWIDTPTGYGGKKQKFRNNLAAIRMLQQLENSDESIKPSQRACLAKYVGWGGLQEAFPRPDGSVASGWDREAFELKSVLSADEYEKVLHSVTDAHYTSHEVVSAMWNSVVRMGFSGGKVLEPACGTGNFFARFPAKMVVQSEIQAVELDGVSARLARQLYPHVSVHQQGFEESDKFDPAAGTYDLVIGNPPFGQQRLHDSKHVQASKHSIHNYFVLKSLSAARPDGVVAMVISMFFLDQSNPKAREMIAEQAQFLGAVRLPNNAFWKNAGTEVTSDIVFFRKYRDDEGAAIRESVENTRWIGLGELPDAATGGESMLPINAYYAARPEMLLGKWGTFGKMNFGAGPALIPDEGIDFASRLPAALGTLPASFMPAPAPLRISSDALAVAAQVEVGEYFQHCERLYQRHGDRDGRPTAERLSMPAGDALRARDYIELRDALTRLISVELEEQDGDMEALRAELNTRFDRFVQLYGRLQSPQNRRALREDSGWSKVLGLEVFTPSEDRKAGVYTKADILIQRTLHPNRPPDAVENALDALLASLAVTARVDLEYMSKLYGGKSEQAIVDELGDRIYLDADGVYVTAEEFLSGDVKAKLAAMKELAAEDNRYIRNVAALRDVIPDDVPASQIDVKIGAHWLPDEIMTAYVQLISEDYSRGRARYNASMGQWFVSGRFTAISSTLWGTDRRSARDVMVAAISQKPAAVYDKDTEGNSIFNAQATAAFRAKIEEMQDDFRQWVFADIERREDLERIYNDRFNTNADRRYNGTHLMLPGKVPDDVVLLQQHQKDAVWRIVSSNKPTLLHHVVGAGKTYVMISAAMELRRLGLSRKPMFVVPNHLVDQWAQEFQKLYPSARVLVPEKKDFQRQNRELLFSRVALGDWDAVMVAHSSFNQIRVSPEKEIEFLNDQLVELKAVREAFEKSEGKNDISVKAAVRDEKKLEARIKKAMDSGDHGGFHFDQLGIDGLFIDESHEYKNLMYTTKMGRVAGITNSSGAISAYQLFIKSRHVLENSGGRNLVFASGTPLSNSIPEMFTLQRYLDYDRMKSLGLTHFDAWASMFGSIETTYELTATQTYKQVSRFSRFTNLPELLASYKIFADVVTREDIERELAATGQLTQIPPIVGGKPQPVISPRSEEQGKAIDRLVLRAENFKFPDNMLAVMTDARKIALDYRIVDPKAEAYENSKIALSARRISEIYRETAAVKGTQLVFCDLSVPRVGGSLARDILKWTKAADAGDEAAVNYLAKLTEGMTADETQALLGGSTWSVYDELKTTLIESGIPEGEIAFIHDADTDMKKKELFMRVNTGIVRVLMGSTSKLGAGANVQERLVALHHLDCPWRPSDVEQREGRILRPGNDLYEADPENFKVRIYRYATERTLDASMWQKIETKATFIGQLMSRVASGERSVDDVSDEAQLAAQMKAEASGDQRLLEVLELNMQVRKMQMEQRAYEDERARVQRRLRGYEKLIAAAPEYISKLEQDVATTSRAGDSDVFRIVFFGRIYARHKGAGEAVIAEHKRRLKESKKALRPQKWLESLGDDIIGTYRGFDLALAPVKYGHGKHVLVVRGASGNYSAGSEVTDHADPAGLMTSLLAVVRGFSRRLAEHQIEVEQARAGAVNLKEKLEQFGESWSGQGKLKVLRHRARELQEAIRKDQKRALDALRDNQGGRDDPEII